ncbi:hypothetical protein ACKFKF_02650 [Phormidesmis sp. 146-12]
MNHDPSIHPSKRLDYPFGVGAFWHFRVDSQLAKPTTSLGSVRVCPLRNCKTAAL